jgi:hypothetical protein
MSFEETFEEYTERRISTYNLLSSYFPESFNALNVNYLRNAYLYKEFLCLIKDKLENILNFKIPWSEFDSILNNIIGVVSEKFYSECELTYLCDIDSLDKFIEFQLTAREKLLQFFGIESTDEIIDSFRVAFNEDYLIKNNWKNMLVGIISKKVHKEQNEI